MRCHVCGLICDWDCCHPANVSSFAPDPEPFAYCAGLLWCNLLEHVSSELHANKYLYKGMGVSMKCSSGYICPFKMNCFDVIWPWVSGDWECLYFLIHTCAVGTQAEQQLYGAGLNSPEGYSQKRWGLKHLSSLPDFLGLWVRFPRSVILKECLHCLSLLPCLLFVLHSIPSGFHSLLKFISLRWPLGCKNWEGFNTDDLFLNFPGPSWKSAMLYPSLAVSFKSLGTSAYHCSTEWQNLLLR